MSSTNLRAAAFLAEQQRLDFRRGGVTRRVRCNPPNRECEGRCIPPNWHCRLKGEGNDPHLKAAGRGTDIVSGFANLQRGFSNIGKGIAKLSFSEVESGRRALARGTAKLHPGDLKKKEEARKAVYNTALWVLTPVVLGITAALGHKGLKSFRIYREGVGRDIDNTFREVTNKIARNTPFGVGEGIRAREAMGRRGLSSVRTTEVQRSQLLNRQQSGDGPYLQETIARRQYATSGRKKIDEAIALSNSANGENAKQLKAVDEWYNTSLPAFWGAQRSYAMAKVANVGNGSVYSLDSANSLLSRSLGLRDVDGRPLKVHGIDPIAESRQVRALIRSRLAGERENIAIGMRQAGLDAKDATSVQQYLQRNASDWETGDMDIDREIERTIINTMTSTDTKRLADELYRKTVQGFDKYYDDIRGIVSSPPGVTRNNLRERQIYQDAARGHAQYLANTIDFELPIKGPGSIELLKKVYHRRRVVGSKARYATVYLTDPELATLASEMGYNIKTAKPDELAARINERFVAFAVDEGRANPTVTVKRYIAPAEEARRKLEAKAASAKKPPAAAPETAPEPRRARRYTANEQQIIQRLLKAGYSEEKARAKAAQYIAERAAREAARKTQDSPERGDSSTWTLRDDAHLETWIRLDKRCGKSGIPDNRKCSKFTSIASPERPARQEPPRSPATPKSAPKKAAAPKTSRTTASTSPIKPVVKPIKVNSTAQKKNSEQQSSVVNTVGKLALASGVVAGTIYGAKKGFQNRAAISKYVKAKNPEFHARAKAHVEKYKTLVAAGAPEVSNRVINRLSQQDIADGINKLPKQFQGKARQLVGRTKAAVAEISLRARGYKLVDVDTKQDFATFVSSQGNVSSVGSVGDSLLTFNTLKNRRATTYNGSSLDVYGVQFMIDESMTQKGVGQADSAALVTKTKAMFQKHLENTPDDALLYSVPFNDDGRGAARTAAYTRFGFTKLPGLDKVAPWDGFKGNVMFAVKSNKEILSWKGTQGDDYKHYISNVLATVDGRKYQPNFVTREAATAKPYKPPKLRTSTNIAPSTKAPRIILERPAEWSDLPENAFIDARHRERKYGVIATAKPIQAETLATRFNDISRHKGVIPENVQRLTDFTKKNNVRIEHKVFDDLADKATTPEDAAYWRSKQAEIEKGYSYSGMFFSEDVKTIKTNTIYVSPKRKNLDDWADSSEDAVKTVNEFMDNVSTHNAYMISPDKKPQTKESFIYNTTYNAATNGDAHDLIVATHETGHAIHEKSGFRQLQLDDTAQKELVKVASNYGLSDVAKSQKELFSETFVLYTFAGERLRKEAPTVYNWIDSIVRDAT